MQTPCTLFEEILLKYWGYKAFRPFQREIIEHVYSGHDTLALLPTGGGKSITFQVAGLARGGLTLVITPLIALMDDQVQTLRAKGIRALALHSATTDSTPERILSNCIYGNYSFLYISPERLITEAFLRYLPQLNIRLLAIDEAHCISQWGHDFRPAYRKIGLLRKRLDGVPTLALTASATPAVQEDIKRQLGMDPCTEIKGEFHRPNLLFGVRKCNSISVAILNMVRRVKGSGIVYTRSRERTEELAHMLRHEPGGATAYHAGLTAQLRAKRQKSWLTGATRIMVATNAFGMGIDKPDTRFVIHVDLPTSLEEYYQEAGRAGRDGLRAYAALFYNDETVEKAKRTLNLRMSDYSLLKRIYQQIPLHLGIPRGDHSLQAYPFDVDLFAHTCRIDTPTAHHYLGVLQRHEILSLKPIPDGVIYLKLHSEFAAQQTFRAAHTLHEQLMRMLTIENQIQQAKWLTLSIKRITQRMEIDEQHLTHILDSAQRYDLLAWTLPKASSSIVVHADTALPLPIAEATIAFENGLATQRAQAMQRYLLPSIPCRATYIANYFGYTIPPCLLCDRCRER